MGGGGYATAPPKFDRGETYKSGGTIDAADLPGVNLVGREFTFEDDDNATGRPLVMKCVRNTSTIALLPGRLVRYQAADPLGCNCDGYTFAVGDVPAGIVDHKLPAAGVPVNDLFYIEIDGPGVGITVDSAFSGCAIGDRLVPGTGTSATSADAGKLQLQSLAGATTVLGANLQNTVGRAEQTLASTAVTANVKVNLRLARSK